jgi:hypothetical protein
MAKVGKSCHRNSNLPWQNAEIPWQNTLCHGKCKLSMHFYKKVLKIEKQNILSFKPFSKYDNLR